MSARLALLLCASLGTFAFAAELAPFSSSPARGKLPGAWKERFVERVPPARIELVEDGGATVLEVASKAGAGAVIHALGGQSAAGTTLAWRWKVDRVVDGADLERRAGDDFAARVYVFFDVPYETLPWATRVKMQFARIVYGEELPTAGICYVWDNRHPVGTARWSPYTDRIRIVVQESGAARAGQWTEARRDLAQDFRAAFGAGWKGPLPAVSGVAIGNDTDQTGESAVARFGDFRLEAR